MKKVCFITGTRADYGIMSRLIREISLADWAQLQIVATNMHLSEEFGMTVNEIIGDGFQVDQCVDMHIGKGDDPYNTVKSMAHEMSGMAEAFENLKPDLIVLLGDRYEMLVAASAALMFHIPVVHLHGGEVTLGALDDRIRHAITQLSALHFAATDEYRERIISMGIAPSKVFNTGALGVENIASEPIISLEEMNSTLRQTYSEGDYMLVTFHPVTMHPGEEKLEIEELLKALEKSMDTHPEIKILFTLPNSDTGGDVIRDTIERWVSEREDRVESVASLGRKRYYCALKNAACVVGNSSSGLIEAPEFGIPTVNIGDRQAGRARGNTVIDCATYGDEIYKAIELGLSEDFRNKCRTGHVNPYHGVDTCETMLREIRKFLE